MDKKHHNLPPNNQIGLLIQCILVFFVIVYIIISAFESVFLIPTQIITSLLMFVMAYNNHKIFKSKGMTYAYLITGIIILLIVIGGLLK
ncbi:MAG: hypothetical protein GX247_00015 [Mollicutes bacterium]|nr:hypothetical protein [Mollicutes bacterium]